MAYEYEEIIEEELDFVSLEFYGNKSEMIRELKEVYKKAKAFDEIREIEKTLDVTGYHEDTESYMYDVESIIENYLEDTK